MAPRGGLEPPTNGLTVYVTTFKKRLNRATKAFLGRFKTIQGAFKCSLSAFF